MTYTAGKSEFGLELIYRAKKQTENGSNTGVARKVRQRVNCVYIILNILIFIYQAKPNRIQTYNLAKNNIEIYLFFFLSFFGLLEIERNGVDDEFNAY